MILEKANSQNIGYIRALEAANREILDLPYTFVPNPYKLRYDGEWYVIKHKEGVAGIIGIAHSVETKDKGTIKFIQVVIEKEFRGQGLFSEAFELLVQEYPSVKCFRLTTINTNIQMQKAAYNAGFYFIRRLNSPNGTGNTLYLYEFINPGNFNIY